MAFYVEGIWITQSWVFNIQNLQRLSPKNGGLDRKYMTKCYQICHFLREWYQNVSFWYPDTLSIVCLTSFSYHSLSNDTPLSCLITRLPQSEACGCLHGVRDKSKPVLFDLYRPRVIRGSRRMNRLDMGKGRAKKKTLKRLKINKQKWCCVSSKEAFLALWKDSRYIIICIHS